MEKKRNLDKYYHIKSSIADQVYDRDNSCSRGQIAAKQTKNQVLFFNGKLAETYFHAACGGHTENVKNVWGAKSEYLRGVECKYCANSRYSKWSFEISKEKNDNVRRFFGLKNIINLKILNKFESGRADNLIAESKDKTKILSLLKLRESIGYFRLKSTMINEINITPNKIVFSGSGFGHGVGMCQWGAKGMADFGFLAHSIVSNYYPGTLIGEINSLR